MSEDFNKQRKKMTNVNEKISISKIKNKVDTKTFSQRVEKAWKNIKNTSN